MSFDIQKEIDELIEPVFWKAGLIHYIQDKEIKTKKDFDKIVKEYKDLKLGEFL